MTTIVIKPKSKAEENLLTRLFKKMNIEVQLFEEPMPNYETRKAMDDVVQKKGKKIEAPAELTGMAWEKLSKEQETGIFSAIDQVDKGQGIPADVVLNKYREKYNHA